MGPRAGLDGRKISSPPGFDPGPPSPYSVAIPTELPGPDTNSYANLSHDTLFIIQYVYISVCAIVSCVSHNRSSFRGHESLEIQILKRIPEVF